MDDFFELLSQRIHEKRAFQLGLLAVITLLAAGVRFYKLGEWSFWFDEVATLNRTFAYYASLESILDRSQVGFIWTPVSIVFTGQILNLMGTSELAGRLVPALLGVLSIPAIYLCAKRLVGVGTALVSAGILAISPWHLFWSQNARFYTSLMLFSMLALFSFFYALERDRPALIPLGYGLLFLAISERLTALLVFPMFLVYLLLLYARRLDKTHGYHRKNLILFFAPGFLFVIFELFMLVTSGNSFLQEVVEVFGVNRGPSPIRLVYRIILNLGVPITCLAAIGGIFLLFSRSRSGIFLVSMAVTPIMVLLAANPVLYTDDRYAFIALPAWVILAAVTIREIYARIRLSNYGAVFVLVLPLLVFSTGIFTDMRYFQSNNGYRLDWRGAFALVSSSQEDGDVVASYWPQLANYYMNQQTVSMRTLRPPDVVQTGRRHWFVIDDYAVWSARNISLWVEQQCELVMFDELLVERPEMLRVYLCEPARLALSE